MKPPLILFESHHLMEETQEHSHLFLDSKLILQSHWTLPKFLELEVEALMLVQNCVEIAFQVNPFSWRFHHSLYFLPQHSFLVLPLQQELVKLDQQTCLVGLKPAIAVQAFIFLLPLFVFLQFMPVPLLILSLLFLLQLFFILHSSFIHFPLPPFSSFLLQLFSLILVSRLQLLDHFLLSTCEQLFLHLKALNFLKQLEQNLLEVLLVSSIHPIIEGQSGKLCIFKAH